MQPLLLIPPLRLVIELLNIPTVEEDVADTCKRVDTSSIEKSIVDMATPTVTPIPGGILDQAAAAAAKVESVAAAVSDPTALLEAKTQQLTDAANPTKLLEKAKNQTKKNLKKAITSVGKSRKRNTRK